MLHWRWGSKLTEYNGTAVCVQVPEADEESRLLLELTLFRTMFTKPPYWWPLSQPEFNSAFAKVKSCPDCPRLAATIFPASELSGESNETDFMRKLRRGPLLLWGVWGARKLNSKRTGLYLCFLKFFF